MPTRISTDCQDLLSKMILVDHKARISALEALKHPWFANMIQAQNTPVTDADQVEMDKEVLKRMQSYRGQSLLKKAAVNVLVKHLEAN